MKKAVQLVFISYAAGITHLAATMELAKLLVARHDQLYITVLIMKLPFDPKSKPKGSDDSRAPSSVSHRIKLINLPEEAIETQGDNLNIFLKLLVENHKPNVKDVVTKLIEPDPSASKPRLVGFVVDLFCTTMIDVANEFGVPTYIFFASTAGFLGLMFHLQTLYDEENKDSTEFKDSDAELVLPSFVNPLPARSVLPGLFLEKPDATDFLNYARRFRETKGILVNTFMELESHALNSLSDGTIPPVYPVGPLLNLKSDDDHGDSEQAKQKSEILKWLDEQPPLSVVFLCFGSRGSCGENQVKEIAIALEHSGLRFLWSLRQPVPKGQIGLPSDYADPNGVLPEGFLDRTAGIGKMIGLAPQVAILAHPAIGGFVSHCGWNSTLESLWYGVPIATWPMYAEQQLNAFELVRELGLGVEVRMDYRSNSPVVVSAGEIERGIRQVMEHDSDVRRRVKEMSEKGQKALLDGGSSHSSLGRFVDQLFLNLN